MQEEYEITWEVSAIDTLRAIYSKVRNKYGAIKADQLRIGLVTKAEILRQMPTKHPLEPALYHLPQKFRFVKQQDYKLIYQVV
jgi:plasmid stabilization system protein ParE